MEIEKLNDFEVHLSNKSTRNVVRLNVGQRTEFCNADRGEK